MRASRGRSFALRGREYASARVEGQHAGVLVPLLLQAARGAGCWRGLAGEGAPVREELALEPEQLLRCGGAEGGWGRGSGGGARQHLVELTSKLSLSDRRDDLAFELSRLK